MKRKITQQCSGNSHIVDFTPTKKSYTAPEIEESFVDDKGDIIHILTNGNQLSENNYIKHWGIPKGIVNLKAKPRGLDGRTNWMQ